MSQLKDKYDLTQPSLSEKPGLETFRRKKDGSYFFHVNDKKGAAFLFSQGYETGESRDKGWQAVLKNAPDKKRYEIKTEQNQFYFVLKAGNNQEIARSRFFDSKLALDKAMEFLMGLFSEATPAITPAAPQAALPAEDAAELVRLKNLWEAERQAKERLEAEVKKLAGQLAELKKGQAKTQAASGKSAPPAATAPPSCKDAFRLEFYHEKDEPVRGRIEHLLSGKKKTFQGWDWNEILQFIGGHVGEEVKLVAAPADVPGLSVSASQPAELVNAPVPSATPSLAAELENSLEQPLAKPQPAESLQTAVAKTQEIQVLEAQPNLAAIAQAQASKGRFQLQFTEKGEAVLVGDDGKSIPLAEFEKRSPSIQPATPRPVEIQPAVAVVPVQKEMKDLEEMKVEVQAAPDASPGIIFRAGQPLYFRFSAAGKELGFDPTGKDADLEIYLKPLSDSQLAPGEIKTPTPVRHTPDGRPFLAGITHLGTYRLLTIARKRGANEGFQGHALVNVY